MSIIRVFSKDFVVTAHVRERFIERFSEHKDFFRHLSKCKVQGCSVCVDLAYKLAQACRNKELWHKTITERLKLSEEVRVFHNNTEFMDRMYERYGYDSRYHFYVDDEILWVVSEQDGRFVLVTCMNVHGSINGSSIIRDFIRRPKFRKKVYESAAE